MQTYRVLPTALFAMAAIAGCSTTVPENALLNEARHEYSMAKDDPQVVDHAATEIKRAGMSLDKANEASSQMEDAAVVTHLAYLAKQQVAIAQEMAAQKQAEMSVAGAAAERGKIRLDARTAEVSRAREEATLSQRQAEAAQQQAADSRRQSEMAHQRASDAEMRTQQLEAQLRELNAKQTERGLVITLGDVLFDTDKSQLKPRGSESLQKLADFLKQYPKRNARIEGYTDSTGSADYNLGLSDRRANAVRASLVGMGVSGDRITTQGFGVESPVADNSTSAGRQLNRRVEIILSDEGGTVSTR